MQNTHNDKYPDVTGVILAGGSSSRMGQDKATLRLEGVSLFERTLQTFQDLFQDILIAGDRPDLARPGIPAVADIYPGSALGGLYTGLFTARTPWIFVAPCDMPYPDPALIRDILARREGYDVVVPCTPDGFEPLFACYHKNCLEVIRSMLLARPYCVYDFYPQVRACHVLEEELPYGWHRSLRNVNTPEDFKALKEKPS
ncbi:MAG: molybdenum cofactor guanylyltransferase [Desulfuromonadales bacterium]|nr:molybdenum cofactor guanylyltransferase [Desulfuromonadales bacterium]